MKIRTSGLDSRRLGIRSSIGSPTGVESFYNTPRVERLTYSTTNPRVNGKFTDGDGFIVDKTFFDVNPGYCQKIDPGAYRRNYTGGFVPQDGFGGSVLASPSVSTPLLDLDYWGTKGFNRLRPNRALYDLGTFVAELRDFRNYTLSVKERLKDLAHGLGGASKFSSKNYLDLEFGIGATIRDSLDILRKQQLLEKRIQQLVRDNGKPVRRTGVVESVESSSTSSKVSTNGALMYPSLVSQYFGTLQSDWIQTETVKTRYWFSGRFRYYIDGSARGLLDSSIPSQARRRLMGVDFENLSRYITLAWELTPWSWLVDWSSTLGDILANACAAATDNLIADYAFIMGEYERKVHTQMTVRMLHGATCYCSRTRVQLSKQRQVASPYGFGLGTGWLTPRRAAILTAIGITKYR